MLRFLTQQLKSVTILVLTAVVLSMAAGWSCAAGSPQSGKMHCKKSHSLDDGITRSASGTCHMLPCQARKASLFAFPDSSSLKLQTEKRYIFSVPGLESVSSTTAGMHFSKTMEGVLKLPSSFIPPPLFSLHCVFIC
jgi:hypothetical protein